MPTTSEVARSPGSLPTLTAIYGVNVGTSPEKGPPPDVDGTTNAPSPSMPAVQDVPSWVALPSACPSNPSERHRALALPRGKREQLVERHVHRGEHAGLPVPAPGHHRAVVALERAEVHAVRRSLLGLVGPVERLAGDDR